MTALVREPTLAMRLRALGRRMLMSEYLILYLCIALFAVLYLIVPRIASPYNISSLLSNMWPLFVVAIGQTFVLIIAGIDLSQGAVISLTSVIGAAFIAQSANPIIFEKSPLWGVLLFENGAILHDSVLGIPVAVGAMLLVGVLIGAFNGAAVAFARIPPFMVTLVTSMFFAALAILLAKSENIIDLPDAFAAIGDDFGIGDQFDILLGGHGHGRGAGRRRAPRPAPHDVRALALRHRPQPARGRRLRACRSGRSSF